MRIRSRSFDEKVQPLFKRHSWFAWHPVRIDGYLVWLETIDRRAGAASWDGDGNAMWEYRNLTGGGESV